MTAVSHFTLALFHSTRKEASVVLLLLAGPFPPSLFLSCPFLSLNYSAFVKWKFFHSSLLFLLLSNFDLAVPILRYMFIYSQQLLQMTVVQIQMIPETWPFFKLWCSWSQILALQISEKAKRPFANDVFSWDRSLFTRVLFYYVETLFSMDEYSKTTNIQ